ncbi:ribonuclease H [Spirochaetia bacterium]|nr:ribonuclease H [Spirochaetia bacterium]
MEVEIYTDGGCSGNPGPGGWAYIILGNNAGQAEVMTEKSEAEKNTTNNRMELKAVIAALEALGKFNLSLEKVRIYTDSQYVQKGMSEWIYTWKRNEWRTSDRQPVKNRDLWQELDALAESLPVVWNWVKGHAGNEYNERCDYMTRHAMASLGVGIPPGQPLLL